MPRFVFEADLRHHLEELVEWTITEIDDRRGPAIGNNTVEQRHLTARVGDIDRPDQVGEARGEQVISTQPTETWKDSSLFAARDGGVLG